MEEETKRSIAEDKKQQIIKIKTKKLSTHQKNHPIIIQIQPHELSNYQGKIKNIPANKKRKKK